IEPPAEANLEHAKVHARFGKMLKRHRGHALKVSGMRAELSGGQQFFDDRSNPRQSLSKVGIANFHPIDANSLIDLFQVRRSVQSRVKSGLPENRFEKSSRRALAIGSRNMR